MPNRYNKPNSDMLEKRREFVSACRLRGMSLRQIVMAMQKEAERTDPKTGGLANPEYICPDTGKAWSLFTVQSDMKAISKEWTKARAENIDTVMDTEIAKLRELEKAAWQKGDLDLVRRIINDRVKLLGYEPAAKITATINMAQPDERALKEAAKIVLDEERKKNAQTG